MGGVEGEKAGGGGGVPTTQLRRQLRARVAQTEPSCMARELSDAAQKNDAEAARRIIDSKVLPARAASSSATLRLGYAVSMHALLPYAPRAQVDVNTAAFSNRATALHRAAFHGSLDVINLLLQHGANPCAATVSGGTPLHNASSRGHAAALDLLAAAAGPAALRPQGGRHAQCISDASAGPACCANCAAEWRRCGGGACGPRGHVCANRLIFALAERLDRDGSSPRP